MRDGRILIAMTRFEGLGGVLANVPLGLTTPEMAAVMGALGARRAVLLDGRVSSQLLIREGSRVHRWPGWRRVPLGLVLLTKLCFGSAAVAAQSGAAAEEALGWPDGLITAELSVFDRQFLRAPVYRLAGEIHERRGDRESARAAYGRFVQLWNEGDPWARDQVGAVRGRIAALAGEGGG